MLSVFIIAVNFSTDLIQYCSKCILLSCYITKLLICITILKLVLQHFSRKKITQQLLFVFEKSQTWNYEEIMTL